MVLARKGTTKESSCMTESLRNQYGGEIPRDISRRYKNLEIIELVGDNFNIAWGRVKGQKFAHRKDAKNAEKIKEKD